MGNLQRLSLKSISLVDTEKINSVFYDLIQQPCGVHIKLPSKLGLTDPERFDFTFQSFEGSPFSDLKKNPLRNNRLSPP